MPPADLRERLFERGERVASLLGFDDSDSDKGTGEAVAKVRPPVLSLRAPCVPQEAPLSSAVTHVGERASVGPSVDVEVLKKDNDESSARLKFTGAIWKPGQGLVKLNETKEVGN